MLLLVIYSPEVVPGSPALIPCVKGKKTVYLFSLINIYIFYLNVSFAGEVEVGEG